LPQDHAALGEIPERDLPGKVGSVVFLFLFTHRYFLMTDETHLAPVNTPEAEQVLMPSEKIGGYVRDTAQTRAVVGRTRYA